MRRVPLPRAFMITGIIGFLTVTVYTASGRIGLDWGIAFDFVFGMMFIASVLSITPPGLGKQEKAPVQRIFAHLAILGFIAITLLLALGLLDLSWSISFYFVFAIIYIASLLSSKSAKSSGAQLQTEPAKPKAVQKAKSQKKGRQKRRRRKK